MGFESCPNDLADFAGLLTEITDQLLLMELIDKDEKLEAPSQLQGLPTCPQAQPCVSQALQACQTSLTANHRFKDLGRQSH